MELTQWMCLKVYGKEEPGSDDNPIEGHSNSALYWKKDISFFMPNHQTGWDVLTNSGNPTKFVKINDLIKTVKKKEVRQQGKPSLARWPLEESEYKQSIIHCGKSTSLGLVAGRQQRTSQQWNEEK